MVVILQLVKVYDVTTCFIASIAIFTESVCSAIALLGEFTVLDLSDSEVAYKCGPGYNLPELLSLRQFLIS